MGPLWGNMPPNSPTRAVGWCDGLVDGLNRLVRPVITFGLLGILPAVVIWPEGAAIAFAALALLPAGYWALVTVIIGFYFGGRMQLKAQDFQKSVQSGRRSRPRGDRQYQTPPHRTLPRAGAGSRHRQPGAAGLGEKGQRVGRSRGLGQGLHM